MNTVVSQAIATGLPVITTNHSGLPEQVLHGKNGLVVPEGDFKALAEAIAFLLEHSELWPAFGRFGRAHAGENYDSTRLVQRQIDYYNELHLTGKVG
jgi:colanic acid/amylovoran biosynthesis glycosyltransferase